MGWATVIRRAGGCQSRCIIARTMLGTDEGQRAYLGVG